MIKKIDHINIVVKDLEKAKEFFLNLGFILIKEREGELKGSFIEKVTKLKRVMAYYCTVSLKGSQTNIELVRYDSPEDKDDVLISKPNHIGIRHIAFEVENIEKFVAELQKKGVKFFSEIQEYKPTKKKLVYCFGPEGVVLELAEYSQ
jgi:catechol 2,3-dioxygenase-like lactoylglutathione lyase family enzyme